MSLSLLLDLYELTMVAGYQRYGMLDQHAVFDLYFRHNPYHGGYAVFAGLEPALEYLEDLRFDPEDIAYLATLGLFDEEFLNFLREFQFRGTVTAAREGEIVFAGEPLLSVEGSLGEVQLVETALLNLINFQTLVATKAARIVGEATHGGQESEIVEFGARRAQGPDGALGATRAAYVGGVRSTSHLAAGRRMGIPVVGTQAHSWVMAFPSELEAFRAYAATFPDHCVLLVDTYDTLRSGVPNSITVARELSETGYALRGIRLDSGDLAYLSREARRLLDEAGFPDVKILASNELDEHIIESVRKEEGRIDVYGIGTRLVTAAGRAGGALNGVYKLVELDGLPRIKISSDRAKSTIPGCKKIWRVSRNGGNDRFEMDVLAGFAETPRPGDLVFDPSNPLRHTRIPRTAQIRDLRTVVMKHGDRTQPERPLDEIADYARQRLSQLPDGCRRLLNPHTYRVTLSQSLNERRARMIEEIAPPAENDGPAGGKEL